ncbi:MAG: hypothetical protein RJA49_2174, partial [Actinomycetota bacterium]
MSRQDLVEVRFHTLTAELRSGDGGDSVSFSGFA